MILSSISSTVSPFLHVWNVAHARSSWTTRTRRVPGSVIPTCPALNLTTPSRGVKTLTSPFSITNGCCVLWIFDTHTVPAGTRHSRTYIPSANLLITSSSTRSHCDSITICRISIFLPNSSSVPAPSSMLWSWSTSSFILWFQYNDPRFVVCDLSFECSDAFLQCVDLPL